MPESMEHEPMEHESIKPTDASLQPTPMNTDPQIVNLDHCISFITKDGSAIRELLSHRNSEIRKQSLAEATISPGCTTEPHYHKVTEEIYFIVSGSGIMWFSERSKRVTQGDAIAIPPGQVHSIQNDGVAALKLLCCCAPAYEHSDTFLI